MGDPISEVPTPDDIRAQLERMIASNTFSRSPQLGAFLRFVVEAALQGKTDHIKAYTIGVEVLRRDVKFDPQLDPIVRVEATRLRRTIDRYYSGLGADDTIRIDLPRGSYVPTFSRTGATGEGSGRARVQPHLLDRLRAKRALLAAIVATVIAVAVITIALLHRPGSLSDTAAKGAAGAPSTQRAGDALPPGNGMPVLFVQRFDVTGTPGPQSISAGALHDTLSDAFSHFDLVNILWQPGTEETAAPGNGQALARDLHADYRFVGSVEYSDDGAARLRVRLIDTADDGVVWSRVFDRLTAGDDRSAAEEAVVRELAGTLLQPFGVIYAHQRGKVLAGTLHDPRYGCLVEVIESFRSFDTAQQSRGRDCLDRLTRRDPSFALGFSYQAALDLREYQYGRGAGGAPGDGSPLERGLVTARRGVELAPESSRAYEMLFIILFARRDLAAALDAGNKSIALNRYDMRSLGAYGSRLIASGDIDSGMAKLRQAGEDATVRPPFEEFFLFLGEYLRNDMPSATFHASQLTGDAFQLGLIARALAAAANGDRDAARRALDRLVALNPGWRDDLRGTLGRFFYAPAVIDRLAADLTAAGSAGRF